MQETLQLEGEMTSGLAPARRRWLRWAVVLGIWTFFGLLNASQFYIGMRAEGMNHAFAPLLAWQLAIWLGWALMTPLILWLGRRFPLDRKGWAQSLALHLLFCAALSAAKTVFDNLATIFFNPFGEMTRARPFADMFWGKLTSQFHLYLLIYGTIIGVGYAFNYYLKFRERETRASQLEAQLTQAQLQALRMQLNPHFLFNTLNGIAGLVRDSRNKDAVRMIAGLSDLLRHALDTEGQQEVPLRQELEFLELYLDIQQMRFSDRLKIELEIAPETLDARVPNLILQPLVENAIRHGIAPRAAGGVIGVTARLDDSLLEIKIYDDGPGLWRDTTKRAASGEGGGIGLANTRARLAQLYGDAHRFDVRDRSEGGVEAHLVLPFRLQPELKL
jgi:hypothetical protein